MACSCTFYRGLDSSVVGRATNGVEFYPVLSEGEVLITSCSLDYLRLQQPSDDLSLCLCVALCLRTGVENNAAIKLKKIFHIYGEYTIKTNLSLSVFLSLSIH